MNDRASAISNRKVGMGRIKMESWKSTHNASPTSPPGTIPLSGPSALSREPMIGPPGSPFIVSL